MNVLQFVGKALQKMGAKLAPPFRRSYDSIGGGYPLSLSVRGKSEAEWHNSVFHSCVRFALRTLPEATLVAVNEKGEADPNHEIVRLVQRPNDFYSGSVLFAGIATSLMSDGNAYIYPAKSKNGLVKELWYIPHYQVVPIKEENVSADETAFIDYYRYTVNGRRIRWEPDEVIHIRDGIDPENVRVGLSPMKAILRELLADEEAAIYTHSILKNLGVPGLLVRPKDKEDEFDEASRQMLKRELDAKMTGEARGSTLVASLALDYDVLGVSPEKLALSSLRNVSAQRICSVLGLDPMVIGLPSENKTYSNYAEAREAAYESFVIPMQRLIADELNSQLLPLLSVKGVRYAFKYDDVRALQGDAAKKFEQVVDMWSANLLTLGQAAAILGIEVEAAERNLRYSDFTTGVGGLSNSPAKQSAIRLMRYRARESEYDKVARNGASE